jgi:hypothetical protein
MKKFLMIVYLSFLAGCGGSGSDDSSPNNSNSVNPQPVNQQNIQSYGEVGKFRSNLDYYQNNADKYVVHYPKGHLDNAPIALFLPGGHIHINKYNGLMKFMASHGYFVIGTQVNSEYSDYSSNKSFDKALAVARQHHPEMDFGKLVVMGHSQGGGLAFPVMKHFLDKGEYGTDSNLIVSIDGWFAFGMDQQEMSSLITNASFIQFGGSLGTGTDPRINLTLLNLMPNTNEKSFFLLDKSRNHMYLVGTLDEVLAKKDLLKPIHRLLDYQFNQNNAVRETIFSSYEDTIERINNGLKDVTSYSGDCMGDAYNAFNIIKHNNINYCQPDRY